jgi:hypothetical protein
MSLRFLSAVIAVAAVSTPAAVAMDMKTYTAYLLKEYGDKATVEDSTILGVRPNGNPYTERFPFKFDVKINATGPIYDQPPCSDIILNENSGSFAYRWCAKYPAYSSNEVQRDFFAYASGRWSYRLSNFLDCQTAADRALMPGVVRLAVCGY